MNIANQQEKLKYTIEKLSENVIMKERGGIAMRFNKGPLGCLLGGCGCFIFLVFFMLIMSIMTNGGIAEIFEELFYMLR